MIKKELKDRLKLLKISLKTFLEDLGYNCNHLKRYKEESTIPRAIEYALLYQEQIRTCEKTAFALQGHKKIISILVQRSLKNTPSIGDMCFFWNKNSEHLIIAPLKKIDEFFYPEGRIKKGFRFCQKFTGVVPQKFYVRYFTKNEDIIKQKDYL